MREGERVVRQVVAEDSRRRSSRSPACIGQVLQQGPRLQPSRAGSILPPAANVVTSSSTAPPPTMVRHLSGLSSHAHGIARSPSPPQTSADAKSIA